MVVYLSFFCSMLLLFGVILYLFGGSGSDICDMLEIYTGRVSHLLGICQCYDIDVL